MSNVNHFLSYVFIRIITAPFSILPYRTLHWLGKPLGTLAYYLLPTFRKRALSNLTLASSLHLSPHEIVQLAKKSFHNLMITCLEYPKLSRETSISHLAYCDNPELAAHLVQQGQGVIFFCGHQANWELLFLEGTSRMPGVAIGRPTKNRYLYRWVLRIRQKFGGKIIEPKSAVKEGLRALRKGAFLGIVGDQGMPDSHFSSSFLGRKAFTSTIPTLLAYRTGAPIFVATIAREQHRYRIHYSDPIYADQNQNMDTEVKRLMHTTLHLFEKSIQEHPAQWLWQHNRWKLQAPGILKRPYRFDSLCMALPQDPNLLKTLWPYLFFLREIYPEEHLTLLLPSTQRSLPIPENVHIRYYHTIDELFVPDYAPKLLFNFTGDSRLSSHYKKLSVLKVVTLADFGPQIDLRKVLCHAC
ncbi:MAG: hypothetical protein KGZ39_00650 [Simkania sp.]|nr:hypothetical protein [Simkania sp.]